MLGMVIAAKVVGGYGVGSKFVMIPVYYDMFRFYLGKEPYPGTLNIEIVSEPRDYAKIANVCKPILISEQKWNNKILGALYLWYAFIDEPFKCKVIAVRPLKSKHPPNILEIVSSKYIRGSYGVKDGDQIRLRLLCNNTSEDDVKQVY